jgi:flagellar motor switch protein FliG
MSTALAKAKSPGLSQDRLVAVLLLSIDQDLAAQVLKRLPDDHIDRVTRAMKELQELAINEKLVASVYEEAVRRVRAGGVALGDVTSSMERVILKAFGEKRGVDVTARANTEILAKRPFAVFEALTAEDLANLLTEEHPQIAAVFLAHLDRSKAGKVLGKLTEQARSDLVHRVATLDRTPPDVVQRVLDVMRKKVKDLGLTTLRSEPKAWIKAAAEILNNMGGGEKAILEDIGRQDDRLMVAIREEMFTFDDLGRLDKKSMQKVLGQVDTRVLALAMKAATADVEQAVFGNLSKRAADMVAEERDSFGPMPLSEVVQAQQTILTLIRDLMDKGEIAAGAAGGEQMV